MTNRVTSLGQEWYEAGAQGDTSDTLGFLDRLETQLGGEVLEAGIAEMLIPVFARLQDLTADDPDGAVHLLLKRLLPYCLDEGPPGVSVERHLSSVLLDRLGEWVGQYSMAERTQLRGQVLARVKARLWDARADSRGACWTAATLGYRGGGVVGALWDVARRDSGEGGDAALSALSSLGAPPSRRRRLLHALHRRVASRPFSPALLNALRQLADSSSIEVIQEHWSAPHTREGMQDQDFLVLHILADIADDAPDDAELQDKVWAAITKAYTDVLDGVGWGLHMGSIVARCNSARMIPELLTLLIRENDRTEGATHRRWLLALRLGESLRPGQLIGWDRADAPIALDAYRRDAAIDTKSEGYFQTAETLHKEAAWDTLLLWGRGADSGLFTEAVLLGETNPYVKARISQQLACFRLISLPRAILDLVVEPRDEPRDGHDGELLQRMAATRVVAAAGSRQAFEALRHFGLTYDGMVLQDSVEALADVAEELAAAGNTAVVDQLVQDVETAHEWRHRRAAAGVLPRLAAAGLLRPEYLPLLVKASLDEERDQFERGCLLEAMGSLPGSLPAAIVKHLPGWAIRGDELGLRALELLAKSGQLVDKPKLLVEQLGLRQDGPLWDRAPDAPDPENTAAIVGLLYRGNRHAFTPAVVSILGSHDWIAVSEILQALVLEHAQHDGQSLPAPIVDALIARIKRGPASGYSEANPLEVLARLAPGALEAEPWPGIWQDWRPEMRAALADALHRTASRPDGDETAAVALLLALARDGQYGVRRSAYRALASRSPASLEVHCSTWASSPEVGLRERAAEAAGWLTVGRGERGRNTPQQLAVDPEPTVRQAWERARRERRERGWADSALQEVLKVTRNAKENPTRAWRYGEAVVRWGDDDVLRSMRETLGMPLAPHVHHWLERIEHDLEEHWDKAIRDWPDPWLMWEGTLEEVSGTIAILEYHPFVEPRFVEARFALRFVEARFALWSKATAPGGRQHAWGGTAWVEDGGYWDGLSERVVITLKDGRLGNATLRQHNGGTIVFAGNGPYPRDTSR
jgi:hypothetical protein